MSNLRSIDFEDRRLVTDYLKRRDEGAFRALYRRHTPMLYAVVLRLLGGSEPDAEDIVQETWVRAAEKFDDFRGDSTLKTWLTGIAINCARNRRRKLARDQAREGVVAEMPVPAPIDRAIDPVDMRRAVDALPDGYREVLLLHDVMGYTHDEVASMLGIESGTSKSQLSRARSSMRRWLDKTGDEDHARRSQ